MMSSPMFTNRGASGLRAAGVIRPAMLCATRPTVRTRPGSMGHLFHKEGFRRAYNRQYSTNLRTTQALGTAYVDRNALIFYTSNVIKLTEGEDKRHEQDYRH